MTGAARYVLGEGRGAGNDNLKPGERSRVAWIGGTGFGFDIRDREDANLARRVMEFDALNQASRTRRCERDVVHLVLAWRPGQTPDRAEMEAAARSALEALGMANAKAIFVCHGDERHPHLHIVASKVDPQTGRAYDLKGNYLKLSTWAHAWERDHGGVLCLGREGANGLREAVAARNAGAVLTQMTAQRPTFTALDLDRALRQQIDNEAMRGAFCAQVLSHADAVRLSDERTPRYTTKQVLVAEGHVLRAAAVLAASDRYGITDGTKVAVLDRFPTMRADQRVAFERATDTVGLSLIDGQAGTGKSYTMAAVREAYEAAGCKVVGLAPTNAVAQDLGRDGFRHFGTAHSELFALNNGRRAWDGRTVVMVDEAAMVDTKMMAMIADHAQQAGAKLILVGDDRQLASIERGGMFGALKDRYGAAALTEITRQYKQEDRRAASMLAEGNFSEALGIYNTKGAIQWRRTQDQARAALVAQWARDSAADPAKSRFVFAYTNADVAELNAALRAVRQQRGELGPDHCLAAKDGPLAVATGDRMQITGNDKKRGLVNGAVGTVLAIDGTNVTVQLDGRQGPAVCFDAAAFPEFRHGYAGTIYKGQGRTLDQTYLYHSEHWRSAASYVALTRHRDKAEMFVATNTARDVRELARQMARVDDRRAASQFLPEDAVRGRARPSDLPEAPFSVASVLQDLAPEPAKREASPMSDVSSNQAHDAAAAELLRQRQAEVDEEGQRQTLRRDDAARRRQAGDPEAFSLEILAQEQLDRLSAQTDEMRRIADRLEAYRVEQARRADEGRRDEERKRFAPAKEPGAEGDIRDADSRYAQALGQHYDMRDPYASLARAAMAEYGAFRRDREDLDRQIAQETDPVKRRSLELRKEIEGADYMAITSHRIAAQSEIIVGRRDTDEAVRQRARAAEYEERAREMRQERRDLSRGRDDHALADAPRRGDRSADRHQGTENDQSQRSAAVDPMADRIRQRVERAQQQDSVPPPEPEIER